MFILLINYVVMSYRRCKGTAVLGDGEIFAGLLPEVVATGAGICDKALTRRWKCVATKDYQKAGSQSRERNSVADATANG